jgi:phage terminase Nu1 subunit (DNA packaging protein)
VPQSPQERIALAERIHAVAEREIAVVEQIVAALGNAEKVEAEGAARTLASLARTLRELLQLDVPPANPDSKHDEPCPRDIDELRRSLERKLEALIAEPEDPIPGESEP